ncbi:MAG: type III pantothenate kinase [Clostridiales bacterium]|nr:type III pantothenate kinase [Clostridiales bacterium]MBR4819103.1 type III pantothenate kinase [Clostridiales bacterium]MBR5039694.1 type III pantothenate kinase [Clostridiales bacterium]MBR5058429.1 type III pantothenate kinase [Clostridiales bacterium]
MILAVDIGNTHILLGGFDDKEILFTELLTTNRNSTDLEYATLIEAALRVNLLDFASVDGAIVSSVVPNVTSSICRAIERFTSCTPLLVGPGVKTGLKIRTDNPAQVGSDLVMAAVAGIKEYKVPQINIYMGTATAFSLIDETKTFVGTSIGAGMGVAADALCERTSQLPSVAFETPKKVIGTNTVDSVKSGLMYQTAATIDGMIERIEEEYGKPCTVVATGRYAASVTKLCRRTIHTDPDLILKGLMEVYFKNA